MTGTMTVDSTAAARVNQGVAKGCPRHRHDVEIVTDRAVTYFTVSLAEAWANCFRTSHARLRVALTPKVQ